MKFRIWVLSKGSKIIRRIRWYKLQWRGYVNISKHCIIHAHDHVRKRSDGSYWYADTKIGRNCFVGVRSLILPGVTIGDECCIGAGLVVTKDIPDHCMAVGVPAKVIKTGIRMDKHARLI